MSLGNLKDHLVNTVFNNCISIEQKCQLNLSTQQQFFSTMFSKMDKIDVIDSYC